MTVYRRWYAWHPVCTHDAGIVWGWPWCRKSVYWKYMFDEELSKRYFFLNGEVAPIEYYKELPHETQ